MLNRSEESDTPDLMRLSVRRGVGKIITAQHYVGVIMMNDGTLIEILPKIFTDDEKTQITNKKQEERRKKAKNLLIEMLKTLRGESYKILRNASVGIDRSSIFECFISMFANEVSDIVKRGLRGNYETIRSNEQLFKGKLIVAEQIRRNYAHKERSFVEYDEFNTNNSANRILKATLNHLYRRTASFKNKAKLKTLLNAFSDVEISVNYKEDFDKIVLDRQFADYQKALMWSKIFLTGKTFTPFSGSGVAFSLLFPMEKLFESYIAAQLQKVLASDFPHQYQLSAQDKKLYLFDEPQKFRIKPDIVIWKKNESSRVADIVMDTKWKKLDGKKNNYGISQADMYQLFAYQKKYNARQVVLLYPCVSECKPNCKGECQSCSDCPCMADRCKLDYKADSSSTHIGIRFINLSNRELTEKSVHSLLKEMLPAATENEDHAPFQSLDRKS
ncbi:MAG: McrC family protein [Desulfovibrionaceae bacterium]|nr:McrC family protein [Desulfovibrionaceae bacterium]